MIRIEPDPVQVGRDADAWCTRCKMDLAHTIVAMVGEQIVQVRCNTCMTTHKYRPPKSAPPGRTARPRRAAGTPEEPKVRTSSRVPTATPQQRLDRWSTEVEAGGEEARSARAYSMREAYEEGELIRHPKFGLGKVLSRTSDDKIAVLFREGEKLLVSNRGGAISG